jgi:uncharacterized membrane protein YebE (DUF533 family)
MSAILTSEDISELSDDQQKAILEALFLAVGIDREVDPEERTRFRETAEAVPWSLDSETIQATLKAARDRVANTTDQPAFLAWISSIADKLPGQELRTKVVRMMASLAMIGDFDRNEKGLLNAFLLELELPDQVVQELREEFGRA